MSESLTEILDPQSLVGEVRLPTAYTVEFQGRRIRCSSMSASLSKEEATCIFYVIDELDVQDVFFTDMTDFVIEGKRKMTVPAADIIKAKFAAKMIKLRFRRHT